MAKDVYRLFIILMFAIREYALSSDSPSIRFDQDNPVNSAILDGFS